MTETKEYTQVPDIHHPIGTLDELTRIGVVGSKLRHTLSCSEQNEKSAGCRYEESCPFHGIKSVSGPINCAIRRVNDEGLVGETVKTCYGYMQTDHTLASMGHPIEICGIEPGHDESQIPEDWGHTYVQRGTRKMHEVKDPDCPGCKRGDCALYVEFADEVEIPKFARPAAMMSGSLAAEKIKARIRGTIGGQKIAQTLGINTNGKGPVLARRPRKSLEGAGTAGEAPAGGTEQG
jgi:hypothetical protein